MESKWLGKYVRKVKRQMSEKSISQLCLDYIKKGSGDPSNSQIAGVCQRCCRSFRDTRACFDVVRNQLNSSKSDRKVALIRLIDSMGTESQAFRQLLMDDLSIFVDALLVRPGQKGIKSRSEVKCCRCMYATLTRWQRDYGECRVPILLALSSQSQGHRSTTWLRAVAGAGDDAGAKHNTSTKGNIATCEQQQRDQRQNTQTHAAYDDDGDLSLMERGSRLCEVVRNALDCMHPDFSSLLSTSENGLREEVRHGSGDDSSSEEDFVDVPELDCAVLGQDSADSVLRMHGLRANESVRVRLPAMDDLKQCLEESCRELESFVLLAVEKAISGRKGEPEAANDHGMRRLRADIESVLKQCRLVGWKDERSNERTVSERMPTA